MKKEEILAKYINPYTDFGFKKLFGEEASKDLLMDFLNELLPEKHKIAVLSFRNSEQAGVLASDRRAIFDIYCETGDGHQFIVEMQKAKLKFFRERAVFYTTFPIREQAEKGDWDFQLKPVYCVAILDFLFEKDSTHYLSNVQLKDQYCEVFYDKLTYIFIEMPRFTKQENELVNHFEKWLYFLKNLESFNSIPAVLKEQVFEKGFRIAELAGYSREQLKEYEESLKIYRDLKGAIDTSFNDGEKIGLEKGEKIGLEKGEKIGYDKRNDEIVSGMYKEGLSIETISRCTGLNIDDITQILHRQQPD